MSSFTTFFILAAFFATLFSAFASPIALPEQQLEKRGRTGRVSCLAFCLKSHKC
jgi:hypothetical protein